MLDPVLEHDGLAKGSVLIISTIKGPRQLSSSFFAHLTVQNDDVGGKSLIIKCSLTLKNHMEEKKEEALAILNEIILVLCQFFKM